MLAIREALVQYDKDSKPFVEVETTPQTFVQHDVKLGLSDGIKVEVLDGVTAGRQDQDPRERRPGEGRRCGSAAAPASRREEVRSLAESKPEPEA